MGLISGLYLTGFILAAIIWACLGAVALHLVARSLISGWGRLSRHGKGLCVVVTTFLLTLSVANTLYLVRGAQAMAETQRAAENQALRDLLDGGIPTSDPPI